RVERRWNVRLTHRGRRSGRPYQVTIWFMRADATRIYVTTGSLKRQWPQNVMANPDVELRIGDETFRGRVTRVEDAAEARAVARRLAQKYWIARPALALGVQPAASFRVDLEP